VFPTNFLGVFGNSFGPPFGNPVLLSFPGCCWTVVLNAELLLDLRLPNVSIPQGGLLTANVSAFTGRRVT
jgi:hypothetical protein